MRITTILFDVDGTLVDSNGYHVLAWLEAFGSAGLAIAPDAIRAQIGKGADTLVGTLLPDADAALQAMLGERHGSVFRARYLSQVKPFPRARDLLAAARARGQDVALASSASRDEVDHHLDLLDAHGLVTATTSGDEVATSKPAPDVFLAALDRLGRTAAETMVVGDSPFDVEAAAACGIGTVAVRCGGFDDATLHAAGAVAIYDDPAALVAAYNGSPLAR